MLSTWVDGYCDKLVTVVSHQFITLTVHTCVQHGVREAPHRAGLSTAAETCQFLPHRQRDILLYDRKAGKTQRH